jgi:hypothetical protein
MLKKIKIIFENKNYSRSSQSKNLILLKFIHFKNDDKILFKENKMLKNLTYKSVLNHLISENLNQKKSNWQRIYTFQQRVKSLNFAAVIFRSNIVFVTAKLVQFLKNSNHFAIANRVIVYLNDIKNLIIEFSRNFSEIFFCANDVAFANNELIKKSSDDYLFKLYDDSINWRAIKQVTMTTFSIETKSLTLS